MDFRRYRYRDQPPKFDSGTTPGSQQLRRQECSGTAAGQNGGGGGDVHGYGPPSSQALYNHHLRETSAFSGTLVPVLVCAMWAVMTISGNLIGTAGGYLISRNSTTALIGKCTGVLNQHDFQQYDCIQWRRWIPFGAGLSFAGDSPDREQTDAELYLRERWPGDQLSCRRRSAG